MKTYEEMVKWITENVPKDNLGADTPEEAALWWGSYRLAESLMDGGIKDLARTIHEGLPATSGEDVTELLCSSGDEEPVEPIEDDLRKWFGI